MRKLKALRYDFPVRVIGDRWEGTSVAECCMAGADGCLAKPTPPEELAEAVRRAAQGQRVLCRQAQASIVEYLRRMGMTRHCKTLTWREREVMLLVMDGASNKDLAQDLGIGEGTVRRHLHDIMRKLGVHKRDEARRKFIRQ